MVPTLRAPGLSPLMGESATQTSWTVSPGGDWSTNSVSFFNRRTEPKSASIQCGAQAPAAQDVSALPSKARRVAFRP